MTTPTKLNDVSTPLSVQPGDPHWTDKNHAQRNAGQAYDYHDPVSLQRGGYSQGNAITMFGKVGFRADQIVANIDHGNILLLELTRRFGTQGEFDFYISYNAMNSTGVLGKFRTDVEHGFDVCKVDLDLLTLNPEVSAAGPGRFRIRFADGESRKTLQAIAPYRTAVRTFEAITLQKPVTYWIKEMAHTFAGIDEAAAAGVSDDYVYQANTGSRHLCHPEGTEAKWTERPHDTASIRRAAEILHLKNNYKSKVSRYDVEYKLLSLPLPASFVSPVVGIPESENWKNQFPIYNHDRLEYTVGNSYDTIVYARVYAYPGLFCDDGYMNNTCNDPNLVLPWFRDANCRGTRADHWIYTHNWSEGVGAYQPYNFYDQLLPTSLSPATFDTSKKLPRPNAFVAGDSSWKDDYEFTYGNHDHTGYQSVLAELDRADPRSFWQNNYATYDNPSLGDIHTIGGPVEHLPLTENSYNVMFNHDGIASDINLYNSLLTMYTSAPTQSSKHTIARTLSEYPDNVPHEIHDPTYYKKGTQLRAFGLAFSLIQEFEEKVGSEYGEWATNDISLSGQIGAGQGGTSNVLYDVSNLSHDQSSYKLNDELRGYYKCCVDHTNREIHLTLDKADYNDPVELDEVVTSAIYVNKATTYDVGFHAKYDATVQIDHAIDPAAILENAQAWDAAPTGDSLVDQIFVPEGALPTSQVQFVSLSAGELSGGLVPRSKQPLPKPIVSPTLTLTVPTDSVDRIDDLVFPDDTLTFAESKQYELTMTNTGGGELTLEFNPTRVSGKDVYDAVNKTGQKIDDFTVGIVGVPDVRQGGSTNSYVLSGGAALEISITIDVQTLASGYDVWIPYTISKPNAGIDTGQISYKATVT